MIDRSYSIHEALGEGSMGAVYRATELGQGGTVALKLLPPRLYDELKDRDALDLTYRLALAHEFQTLASLHHPNVIRVLSYGFDEQRGPYFTMDLLVPSLTLVEAAANRSVEDKIRLVAQLLRALSYIHRRGVIHRDIKPNNVLVISDEVKLLDFGISVVKSQAVESAGSVEYMAPELLCGQPPSPGSDCYAVGVLFHQMLCGVPPQKAVSFDDMLDSLLNEDLSNPAEAPPIPLSLSADIPESLQPILTKLLAQQPAERYSDADAALRALAATVSFGLQVETAATRESFLRATTLVGRGAELTTLTEGLKQVAAGRGGAYLIGGESGVGKSRLIAELRTLALVYGWWVAEGQSTVDAGAYYQEWQPLLRALCFRSDMTDAEASVCKGLLPNIGSLLNRSIPDPPVVSPAEAQARIVRTLIGLLQRQSKPLLLILEDVHWIRSESMALLSQLSQRVESLPILVVATFRSDESPSLARQLPAMHSMMLQRLGLQEITLLSESILGRTGQSQELVSYLARQTEGNVFFLIEIMRALAENAGELQRIGQGELPETVLTLGIERILERRIEHVQAAFRPVLEFAACMGRRLDLPVLERAFSELPLSTVLFECANSAVLESQGSEWRFTHDKLRESILRRIDPDRQRSQHREIALAIESVYPGESRDAVSAALATHFRQAAMPEEALQYYLRAGDCAIKLSLHEDARAHYAAAQATLAELPETAKRRRLWVDVLLRQVQAGLTNDAIQLQNQRLEKARLQLESLAGTADATASDRLLLARVDYYCGRVLHYSGQPREAIRFYQRVLPVAKEFGDQELLIMPSLVIGLALCMQGQFGTARVLLGEATQPMIQYFGTGLDTMRCLVYHSTALAGSGSCQQAHACIAQAVSLMEQHDQPTHRLAFMTLKLSVLSVMRDWPVVLKVAEQLLGMALQLSETVAHFGALDQMAWAQSQLGRHEEAAQNRARAKELRRPMGGGIVADWFEAAEAEILLAAGRPHEAIQQAAKVAASSKAGGLPFSAAMAEQTWGRALSRLGGELADVEAHYQSSIEISLASAQAITEARTNLWWGQSLQERGHERAAQDKFAKALSQLEAGGYEYALREAQRIARNR